MKRRSPLSTTAPRNPQSARSSPDLVDVLMKGLDDFNAKPSHILLLVVIYPLLALIAARVAAGYDMLPLVFPLLSGFALIGPVAALGLYELSRRRELGLDMGWSTLCGWFTHRHFERSSF